MNHTQKIKGAYYEGTICLNCFWHLKSNGEVTRYNPKLILGYNLEKKINKYKTTLKIIFCV